MANGKRYVGITKNDPKKRWGYGCNYRNCTYFNNALKKYGWEGFTHEVLAEGLTAQQACDLERYYIALWKLNDHKHGYNLHGGGYINKQVSDETRRKLSESHMGKVPWNKGVPMTPEANERFHAATRGRKHTDDEKRRVSQALKGRKKTAEHIRKVSEAQRKRVYQFTLDGEFVREYPSVRITAETFKCSEAAIVNNCLHKTKSSHGFRFEYVKET